MDLQLNHDQKIYFTIKEGSNYKVIDSYNVHYVIEFEQFKKLTNAIFNADVEFVTINNQILNKRFIYKIEPTEEKTLNQLDELQKKQEEDLLNKYKSGEISKEYYEVTRSQLPQKK